MRDQPADKSLDILVDIARGFDGKDRSYLEALGTGATGKEAALYDALRRELGVKDDPLTWPATFTWIAWRLHVPAAVTDLTARASATQLSLADRTPSRSIRSRSSRTRAASKAMLALAAPNSPLREPATWWLLNRMSNDWADHGLRPALKRPASTIPDAITLEGSGHPAARRPIFPTCRSRRSSR